MPNISQILRARRRRHKKYANISLRFSGLGFATSVSILVAILFIGVTLVYISLTRNLPALETIPTLLEPPTGLLLRPTRFYDRDGTQILLELEHPSVGEREYLPIVDERENSIPEDLIHATIAYSDPTFWNHPGFTNLGSEPESPKTLAQRLVSDLLMWDESASRRQDLRERLMAAQITGQYGRQKVLEWYLNSAYFGNQVYGFTSASKAYFGKSVDQLNLAEIATLAAIAHEPSINPVNTPDTAIERGIGVIDAMLSEGYISSGEALKARKTEISFQDTPSEPQTIAPAFINLVREQLSELIPDKRLERGGFEIFTSLDYDLQEQANCATQAHLANLAGSETADQECEAARLLPSLVLDDGDYGNLVSNSIVLDPLSGQVLAMVGDATPGLDPAHLPGHSPGSLLTPFAYLTALTRGFNSASLLWDIPSTFSQSVNQVTNPDDDFRGPMRLRVALANDYLIPALGTLNQIGAENVWRTVGQFGIQLPNNLRPENTEVPECPGCQYLMGGGEVTLLDMAQAFGILSNLGSFVGEVSLNEDENQFNLEPVTLLRVSDLHGGEWIVNQPPTIQPVTSPQLAYLINHMLSDESARWESLGHPNPLEIGQPVAAKMGRTVSGDDIWTIGYTPHLVVGVWMGTGESDSLEAGHLLPKFSSALWHAIIKYATRDLPAQSWAAPPGINTLTVCDPSGMLPTRDCPTVVSEVFLSGHEPTQPDSLYQNYQINRETGRLATVFTPPELIEERVYMIVPPEASEWANESGIPAPPEFYDVIYTPSPSPDTRITSPVIFTNIKGDQTIEGTASGSDFVSYRLQVGKGLNPQSWIAISDDIETPVVNGNLATWETSDLSGLYAVQLVVVRSDQQVDTDTIQLTIDNQHPEIVISHPEEGQIFEYQATVPVTFQVQASDNIGLGQIEYFLNDNLIEIQTQPPYAYAWLPRIGDHTLEIRAVDLAGNEGSVSTSFSIQR
ncbi:MAG: transglycosylase domain-containing protein [Anaerolineales bacterium]|nr:transglycosylase domain-containing protein [Chloroflexota bacterium]MBL6981196.1 transglycosylase domain-containing protein [Anaerolineales bacterium]